MLGKTLSNRYRLEKKIGSGGYGTVYLATDLRMNVPRAVKILSDEGDRAEFIREARIAQGFSHPNVVRVLDVIQPDEEEIPYLVMEFLDGESLGQMIKRGRFLSVEEIRLLVVQIGAALQDAHEKGYVHRDLKPDNVMFVDKHAGDPQFILLDFGIAANFQSTKTMRNAVGDQAGTLLYMSPEQVNGKIDPAFADRIDIYSFSGILYQLICGRVPFPAVSESGEPLSPHTILTRILESPPPPLSSTPIAALQPVLTELQQILFHALAKLPAQRPANIFDFCDEIRIVLGKVPSDSNTGMRTRSKTKDRLSFSESVKPVEASSATMPPPVARKEHYEATQLVDSSVVEVSAVVEKKPEAGGAFSGWDASSESTMRPASDPSGFDRPVPVPVPVDHSTSSGRVVEEKFEIPTTAPSRVRVRKRGSFSWVVAVVAGLFFGAVVVCGGAYFVLRAKNSEIRTLLRGGDYRSSWQKAKGLRGQLSRFQADELTASLGLLSPQAEEVQAAWEQELGRLAGLFQNCRFDEGNKDRIPQYLNALQEWHAYEKINSADKQANGAEPFVQAGEAKVGSEISGCQTRIGRQLAAEGQAKVASYFKQDKDSDLEGVLKVASFFLTPGGSPQATGLPIVKELEQADKKQLEMAASRAKSASDAASVSNLLISESLKGLKSDTKAVASAEKLLAEVTKLPLSREDLLKQLSYLRVYAQAKSVDHSSLDTPAQAIHEARKGWKSALASLKELPEPAALVDSTRALEEMTLRKNIAECSFRLAERKFQQITPGSGNGATLAEAEQEVDPKNYLESPPPDITKIEPAYSYALFRCEAARTFFAMAHFYSNPSKNKEERGSALSLFDDRAPFQFQNVNKAQLDDCSKALTALSKYRGIYGTDPLFKSVIETGRRPFKDYTLAIEDQIVAAGDSTKTADPFGVSEAMSKILAFLEYACEIDSQIAGNLLWELDSATEVLTNLNILKGIMSEAAGSQFETQLASSRQKIAERWRSRKTLVEKEDHFASAQELQETLPCRETKKDKDRKKLADVFDILCRHFHASTNCRDLGGTEEKMLSAREKFKNAYQEFMTIHYLCLYCSEEFEKDSKDQSEERFRNTSTLKEDLPRALRQLTALRSQVTSTEDVADLLKHFQSTKTYADKLIGKERLSDKDVKDEFQKKLFSGIKIEW